MIVGVGVVTASSAAGVRQDGGQGGQDTPPKAIIAKPAPRIVDPIPAITFATGNVTYIPARMLAERLELPLELDKKEKFVSIGDQKFEVEKRLYGGDILVELRDVAMFGAVVQDMPEEKKVLVSTDTIQFDVTRGEKRVEVDQETQELTGYQGDVVVIRTNVSTGAPGHRTPNGEFVTGPVKERMHYSRKYNNAPMPYSIQVNGDIFFHGFTSVPSYPASHGCVRVPLGRKNPARYLYNWCEVGVDAKIHGSYSWQSSRRKKRNR